MCNVKIALEDGARDSSRDTNLPISAVFKQSAQNAIGAHCIQPPESSQDGFLRWYLHTVLDFYHFIYFHKTVSLFHKLMTQSSPCYNTPLCSTLFSNPFLFLLEIIALVSALTFHEFAHAWMADKLGDPTPRLQDRLTLNPAKHLDPLGTLLLLVAGFGWGKPVEFDPFNLRHPRRDTALIALAGPVSNILMASSPSRSTFSRFRVFQALLSIPFKFVSCLPSLT